jgi:pyridoxal phosphate enzyme (YggS family)
MANIDFFNNLVARLKSKNVCLVAVSKTRPVEAILKLYEAGQRIFGENKVQDLLTRYEALPKDINWHLIGHLQRNKVKYIAPFVTMIHAVDGLELLQEIDKQAKKNDRVIDCLLQFYIAKEETKFGLDYSEAEALLNSPEYAAMQNIRIVGVMGMASFVDDEAEVRAEFKSLKQIFEQLKKTFFVNNQEFKEISMGMSGDYEIAIAEGATMVRVGSLLFL